MMDANYDEETIALNSLRDNVLIPLHENLKDKSPDEIKEKLSNPRIRSSILFSIGTLTDDILDALNLDDETYEFFRANKTLINGYQPKM